MHPLYDQQTGGIVVAYLTVALHVTGQDYLDGGACCDQFGQCVEVTQEYCAFLGWKWLGFGSQCLGDVNPQDGRDDACGIPAFSQAGLALVALLLIGAAAVVIRRNGVKA